MDLIDKITMMLGEEGESSVGTTTGDVAKVPQGTRKMSRKKKKTCDEEEEE